MIGVILGGRLGYVLFYKPGYYAAHPLEIFAVWKGGMAFHGGLLGVLVALCAVRARAPAGAASRSPISSRRCVPLGLAAGRIGNFINGELWGASPTPTCPGRWCSRSRDDAAAPSVAALPVRARGPAAVRDAVDLRARSRAGSARCRALFLVGYGVFRFIAEYAASPTASSACSRSA